MKQDIILAGVGGQGILSIAFVIDHAALEEGLRFKQAEVHGMARRGGAVQSHVRLSSGPVFSDLIPKGEADMILSVEPLEAVRYFEYLRPGGIIISSSTPYRNIPDYPDLDQVLSAIREAGRHAIVDSESLAKEAGASKAQNMVMLGAAAEFLILKEAGLRVFVEKLFKAKGPEVVESNLRAFDLGKGAASGA
jgi:indolepyruvate ferredoxin oxidoreductase beta subunit